MEHKYGLQTLGNYTEEQTNILYRLDAVYPIDVDGLLEGLSRLDDYSKFGWTFEKAATLIAKLHKITGRSGAIIGNSLKTIYTCVKSGNFNLNNLKFQTQILKALLTIV